MCAYIEIAKYASCTSLFFPLKLQYTVLRTCVADIVTFDVRSRGNCSAFLLWLMRTEQRLEWNADYFQKHDQTSRTFKRLVFSHYICTKLSNYLKLFRLYRHVSKFRLFSCIYLWSEYFKFKYQQLYWCNSKFISSFREPFYCQQALKRYTFRCQK